MTSAATVQSHPASVDAYIRHGWSLVPIPPGTKGPRTPGWNLKQNALKTQADLPAAYGIGLAHAYSGTMAFDIDNWDATTAQGIDVQTLYDAPDAVVIHSGRPGHGKLLYQMPFGLALPSKKVIVDGLTAYELPEVAQELGIRVVPIYLRFGEKTYRDGVDMTRDEFYSMLTSSPVHPATSQPNPEDFTSVYKEYCDRTEGIVSIHISSKISGTYNSATIAKKTLKSQCPIEVIDSKFNSAGLGLVVTAASRMVQAGAGFSEVIKEAYNAANQVGMFGMFETMKYLARSGRVNKTIAAASSILNIMPLLTFHDGEIVRAGLVRSINKGIDRIYNFVKNNTPIGELTIVHSKVAEQASQLKKRLGEFVQEEKINIAELGAGLGVHGGPGVLLAAIRRSDIA